jgi:hypothetical protein
LDGKVEPLMKPTDPAGKGEIMLVDELLKAIQADREREIIAAQRARSAARPVAPEPASRTAFHEAPTPTFGGRVHPGKAATGPTA